MPDVLTMGGQIANNHWEQGSILPGPLVDLAIAARPSWMQGTISSDDWLMVVSHPCDLVNSKSTNEPAIEVLRLTPHAGRRPDSGLILGQNPRRICVVGHTTAGEAILHAWAHERWLAQREILTKGTPEPTRRLPAKVVDSIALWLSKRYVRAAFPGCFDSRWRGANQVNLKQWQELLDTFRTEISAVYLRLSTEAELHDPNLIYQVRVLVVFDQTKTERQANWSSQRAVLQTRVEAFWKQFPGITCSEVLVQATNETTLDEIRRPWRKFEADWLSFVNETGIAAESIADDAGA